MEAEQSPLESRPSVPDSPVNNVFVPVVAEFPLFAVGFTYATTSWRTRKKKQTREERLEKKRQAERLRYQRMKSDPVKNAKLKDQEKLNYFKKRRKDKLKS
ncbi:hypothetical protein evm_001239 [Chilo suppressalis]|nr:hypothetical protein evm_001239 [Chilo suppressalis]